MSKLLHPPVGVDGDAEVSPVCLQSPKLPYHRVVLLANSSDSTAPGYQQWLEAEDEDGDCYGIWMREAVGGSLPTHPVRVRVLVRQVATRTGTVMEAFCRFNEWQAKGHPEAWLLSRPEGEI